MTTLILEHKTGYRTTRVLDLAAVVADTADFVDRASEVLGVSRRSAERWFSTGVNWKRADEIAVKMYGKHPMSIWGNDWAELADEYAALAEVLS